MNIFEIALTGLAIVWCLSLVLFCAGIAVSYVLAMLVRRRAAVQSESAADLTLVESDRA
jgi:hypothetical protein